MKQWLLYIVIIIPFLAQAQERDSTLTDVINHGTFTGRGRSFFMATINQSGLPNYFALGAGAGIGYESPEIRKFRMAASGFFIYNMASSDVSKPDAAAGMLSRYEIGLFDITNSRNRSDLARLEELYLQYRIRKSFVRVGKMILQTPFVNPQDWRMRPTLEQGIWAEMNEVSNTRLQAGWITDISPRSTVNWFSVENSMGIYPGGVNEFGIKSDYAGNVSSKGLALAGMEHKQNGWTVVVWNTFIENISNTILLQSEGEFKSGTQKYYGGLQFIHQNAVGNGGNRATEQRYMAEGAYSTTWSARIGWLHNKLDVNINGTCISDDGKFLMPREWGRDPFYTFLPRERNEGLGDVRAFSVNIHYSFPSINLKTSIGLGQYHLPDVTNFRLNKYGMPSYRQLNIDLRYRVDAFLKGGDIQFLYVYKRRMGNEFENEKNILNKVNMSNFNLVFNYYFKSHHH